MKKPSQRQRIEALLLKGRFVPAFKFLDMRIPRYGDILFRMRNDGFEFVKYRKGNQDFWLCVLKRYGDYATLHVGMVPVKESQYKKIREESIDWRYCSADTKKGILKLI